MKTLARTRNRLLMTSGFRKEGNVLFNDALNGCLWFYGVRYMVNDHSDSGRGNLLLLLYRLLFPIRNLLYAPSHRQKWF